LDHKRQREIDWKDISGFCYDYSDRTEKERAEKRQLGIIQRNLKTSLYFKQVDLAQLMECLDLDEMKKIERGSFIFSLRDAGLMESPLDLNLLANHYRNPSSRFCFYTQFLGDLQLDEHGSNEPSNAILREIIVSHASKHDLTLKQLFDQQTVRNRMIFSDLSNLIKNCGFNNMNRAFLESLYAKMDKTRNKNVSFFEFLTVFEPMTIYQELGLIFYPYRELVETLKAHCKLNNTSFLKMFCKCRSISQMELQIRELPEVQQKGYVALEFCRLFEDNMTPTAIESTGLDLIDNYLPQGSYSDGKFDKLKFTIQQENELFRTNASNDKRASIIKMVAELDKFMKEDGKTEKEMFGRFDESGKGLVAEHEFE
jgi:hypothetical protein